jgi:hypothetical protein
MVNKGKNEMNMVVSWCAQMVFFFVDKVAFVGNGCLVERVVCQKIKNLICVCGRK